MQIMAVGQELKLQKFSSPITNTNEAVHTWEPEAILG